MTYGKFEIIEPSAPPELDLSWSVEKKAKQVLEWLEINFQSAGNVDFFDFVRDRKFENFDELQLSFVNLTSSSRDIVLKYFGNSILANQLDEILRAVENELYRELFPVDQRYRIDVIERGDDEQTKPSNSELVQTIIDDIPSILELLAAVRSDIPSSLGHNRGPGFLLKDDKIKKLEEQLRKLQTTLKAPNEHTESLIAETGEGLQKIGSKLATHVSEMTKVTTLKFAEKFGESTGTWAGRVAILTIFGERLLQLLL